MSEKAEPVPDSPLFSHFWSLGAGLSLRKKGTVVLMPAFRPGWRSLPCVPPHSGLWIGVPRSPGMTQLHIQSMRLTQIKHPARQACPGSRSGCQGGSYPGGADGPGDSMAPTSITRQRDAPQYPPSSPFFPAAARSGKTSPGGAMSWLRGASVGWVPPGPISPTKGY